MLVRLTLIACALGLSATAQAQTTPAPGAEAPAKPGLDLALYNLDTPIGTLIDHEKTRAVLDKHLPGLSTDKNLDKFRQMSLREFQPYTGGKLTDKMLEEVAKDLSTID